MNQQINLYQPLFRRQEKKFSAQTMLQATALVLGGIVVIYGLLWWNVAALRSERATLESGLVEAHRRLADVSQRVPIPRADPRIEREARDIERRLQAIERLRSTTTPQMFQGMRGYSDYFIAFARQTTGGMWLTGATIAGAGEQVVLEGRTLNPELVPRYLQKLSNEKSLSGTEFEVFQMNRPPVDEKAASQNEKKSPRLANYVEFTLRSTAPKPAAGGAR